MTERFPMLDQQYGMLCHLALEKLLRNIYSFKVQLKTHLFTLFTTNILGIYDF